MIGAKKKKGEGANTKELGIPTKKEEHGFSQEMRHRYVEMLHLGT